MKTKSSIILLVVMLLAACSPKASPTPAGTLAPIQSGESKVTITGFTFDPAALTITTGSTVTWTNNDGASHTITGDNGSWGSDRLAKGETFSFTFTEAGTFSYHCSVHPSMKATITVVAP
jgi:plastocyanin